MALTEKFNTMAQKVADVQNEMLFALEDELKNRGEQNFIYDDETGIVPTYFINDYGEAEVINIDKIRFNDSDIETIEVHDSDNDTWEDLFMFSYDTISIIISYIDWN